LHSLHLFVEERVVRIDVKAQDMERGSVAYRVYLYSRDDLQAGGLGSGLSLCYATQRVVISQCDHV
jgi:hypothetical protein